MQRPLSFLIELALGCPRARRDMELEAWPRGYSGVSTEVAEDAGEDAAIGGEEAHARLMVGCCCARPRMCGWRRSSRLACWTRTSPKGYGLVHATETADSLRRGHGKRGRPGLKWCCCARSWLLWPDVGRRWTGRKEPGSCGCGAAAVPKGKRALLRGSRRLNLGLGKLF